MLTSNERIDLALAACEGLTDTELKQRGPGGFKAMIERKRKYSAAANQFATAAAILNKRLNATVKQLAQVQANVAEMNALDVPVADVTQAADMLSALSKKDAK